MDPYRFYQHLVVSDSDLLTELVASLLPSEQSQVASIALNAVVNNLDKDQLQHAISIAQVVLANSPTSAPENTYEIFVSLLSKIDMNMRVDTKQQLFALIALLADNLLLSGTLVSDECLGILQSYRNESEIAARILLDFQHKTDILYKNYIYSKKKHDIPQVDPELALKNVVRDIEQDWYQDPFKWPEYNYLSNDIIVNRLRDNWCSWTFAMDIPKQSGGTRPAMIINPLDRCAMQCIADQLSLAISHDMPEWVYGWRLQRRTPVKGVYASNSVEWKSFKQRIKSLTTEYEYVLKIDIRSFFESINTDRLISGLGRTYRKTGLLKRLASYFTSIQTRRNGRGLPQRSLASSILAQSSLQSLDAFLTRYANHFSNGIQPVRWMDDIWLFADSEDDLWKISGEIEGLLDAEGLNLNPDKTKLIESKLGYTDFYKDISSEGDTTDEFIADLEEKLTEMLEEIGEAPRSELSYFLKYRGFHSGDIHNSLISKLDTKALEDSAHVADRIADFIYQQSAWQKFVLWYKQFIHQNPEKHNWLAPTWARMFPVSEAEVTTDSLFGSILNYQLKEIPSSLMPTLSYRISSNRNTINHNMDILSGWKKDASTIKDPFVIRAIDLAIIPESMHETYLSRNINE